MFGIFLIYFIGKHFYKLAEDYSKSKWGYVLLGVITYYASAFFFGVILQIIFMLLSQPDYLENMSELGLGLLAMPVGILDCYLLHVYLKKINESNKGYNEKEINDIGKD